MKKKITVLLISLLLVTVMSTATCFASEQGTTKTETEIGTETFRDHMVTKVWVEDDELTRPDSVQVQLYCNGEAFGDPVTLNDNNQWTYTWENLSDFYEWTVDEINVPEGYSKSLEFDGVTTVITNSKDQVNLGASDNLSAENTDVEEASNGNQTEIDEDETTNLNSEDLENEEASLNNSVDETAPKTGDGNSLWIYIVTILGSASIILGIRFSKRFR